MPLRSDAATWALSPLIALAHRSDARVAAVIGQGTGMSTHLLLGSRAITDLYTIEIEPADDPGVAGVLPGQSQGLRRSPLALRARRRQELLRGRRPAVRPDLLRALRAMGEWRGGSLQRGVLRGRSRAISRPRRRLRPVDAPLRPRRPAGAHGPHGDRPHVQGLRSLSADPDRHPDRGHRRPGPARARLGRGPAARHRPRPLPPASAHSGGAGGDPARQPHQSRPDGGRESAGQFRLPPPARPGGGTGPFPRTERHGALRAIGRAV